MSTVAYNSTEIQGTLGTFSGGLGGAPTDGRAVWKAKPTRIKFSFTQGAAQGNLGDTIRIADLPPTAWVYDWVLVNSASASSSVSLGKIDGNSLVVSATYFSAAFSVSSAAISRPVATSPLPIVVGPDPAGDDSSAAQSIPNYGSAFSQVILTVSGAGLAANMTINGYLDVVLGN